MNRCFVKIFIQGIVYYKRIYKFKRINTMATFVHNPSGNKKSLDQRDDERENQNDSTTESNYLLYTIICIQRNIYFSHCLYTYSCLIKLS